MLECAAPFCALRDASELAWNMSVDTVRPRDGAQGAAEDEAEPTCWCLGLCPKHFIAYARWPIIKLLAWEEEDSEGRVL